MENQKHGFLVEDEIRQVVFGLTEKSQYTSIHDIDKHHNIFDSNENISIKTITGNGSLCMGCPRRIFLYPERELHTCILVRLKQDGESKVVTEIMEISLDDKAALFGELTVDDIQEYMTYIRKIPCGKVDLATKREIHQKKEVLNRKSGIIQFNPKVDSNTQRRVQCSISKLKSHPELVKYSSTVPIIRGIEIASSFLSGIRKRHGRV
jgi:hypothetical protein